MIHKIIRRTVRFLNILDKEICRVTGETYVSIHILKDKNEGDYISFNRIDNLELFEAEEIAITGYCRDAGSIHSSFDINEISDAENNGGDSSDEL